MENTVLLGEGTEEGKEMQYNKMVVALKEHSLFWVFSFVFFIGVVNLNVLNVD